MKLVSKMFTSTFAAAALMTSLSAGAVMVKSADAKSVTVSTSGLDLTSTEGQVMLHAKLQNAARQVCGPTNIRETGSIAVSVENRNCAKDAFEKALKTVETQVSRSAQMKSDQQIDNS